LGWLIGISVFIAVIGALVPEMSRVFDATDTVRLLIESIGGTGAMIPAFLSTMLALAAIAAVGYTIQGLNKLRSEEVSGYLENLFATRLSRTKWLATHLSLILTGGAVLLALSGAIMALATNIGTEFDVNIWDYVLAGLAYFPMLLIFAGAYVLLFGILPRAASAVIWAYYGFLAFVTWVGPMLRLDQWVMHLSIMAHFAAAPAESIAVVPLMLTSIVAIIAAAIGIAVWRQRNLIAN
jgi:ABC-2 type transport system permease protein